MNALQAKAPELKLDVRPAPERTCPQAGCVAVAVSALVIHMEGGCMVAGMVQPKGVESGPSIYPWIGKYTLKGEPAFREAPESFVTITDFAPCDGLDWSAAMEQMSEIAEAALAGR